jgi:homoaconitase/3-isopropylmalate dehydratase large subunit
VSSVVQQEAEASGDWCTLLGAGSISLISDCGPCTELGVDLLKEGEVPRIGTTKEGWGHRATKAYLVIPAVVAVGAASGFIPSPASLTPRYCL